MVKKTKTKFPSELRFDTVSRDWVVIATGRAKRPETFKKEKRKKEDVPREDCPFCQLNGQERPVYGFYRDRKTIVDFKEALPKKWSVVVIPNKYPAVIPYAELEIKKEGDFYRKMNAVGFHEVVITRSHTKSLGQFSVEQVKEVIDVYQDRYLELMKKRFVNYVSIFHNHSREAGASIAHPHSQIITTPLIDIDLEKALVGSKRHYGKEKECSYCQLNKWERKFKKRIVFENEKFLALCPFASKAAFEVIISPKNHQAYFEKITGAEKWQLAEAFQKALGKLYKGLSDPAYNFYLHTAPSDGKNHEYYHWHWTILPKTATWAGFEIGTRMEISTIEPERAAEYLRKQ